MNKMADVFLALADDERSSGITADDVLEALRPYFPASRRNGLRPDTFVARLPPPVNFPGIVWQDGAYHARNEDDVQRIVHYARSNGCRVRAAGAQHSVGDAVYSDDPHDLRIVLDGSLRSIEFVSEDATGGVVSVGGGCYLGVNPSDPSSNEENSLNAVLDTHGFALPILGGISHQTVAGFLQTCSSGGSTSRGLAEAVVSIQVVDGSANVKWLHRGDDAFYAACISMGLYGVVTRVVLAVFPSYFVKGEETNHDRHASVLTKNAGKYVLEKTLQDVEYFHANWFPQRTVHRVTHWTGTSTPSSSPVDPYDSELKSGFMNVVAAFVLAVTSGLLAIDPDGWLAEKIVGALLRLFVPLDKKETFNDRWFKVLPCDDQARVDSLMKVIFTEVWLPFDQLTAAIDILQAAVGTNRVAGNFVIELYGAEESPFWLSPSFGRKVVRIDVFWWAYSFGDPREHFTHFWKALLPLDGARLHWGKHLPDVGGSYGSVVFDVNLLQARYPRLTPWLALRQHMDPNDVFLTAYWRRLFGL